MVPLAQGAQALPLLGGQWVAVAVNPGVCILAFCIYASILAVLGFASAFVEVLASVLLTASQAHGCWQLCQRGC